MSAALNPLEIRAQSAVLSANARCLRQQRDALDASMALVSQGFTLAGVRLGGVKPTLQIEASPRLARMVDDNQAAYYKRSEAARVGAFDLCDCQVTWTEPLR